MIAGFGAVHSWLAVLAWPSVVLLGVAFSAPISAFGAWAQSEGAFNPLFRFAIMPMFLFSGTFFPVTRLPQGVRDLAYATPLWHGVALCRSLSLGTAQLGASAGHVAYLAVVIALGVLAGNRTQRRRPPA